MSPPFLSAESFTVRVTAEVGKIIINLPRTLLTGLQPAIQDKLSHRMKTRLCLRSLVGQEATEN